MCDNKLILWGIKVAAKFGVAITFTHRTAYCACGRPARKRGTCSCGRPAPVASVGDAAPSTAAAT